MSILELHKNKKISPREILLTFYKNKGAGKNRILTTCMVAVLFLSLITLHSCMGGGAATDETPTRGNIKITADESFQPVVDTEVSTFTQLYTNAKIKPQYKPEFDVINDFMNDSIKVIVTTRKLTEDQIKYLDFKNLEKKYSSELQKIQTDSLVHIQKEVQTIADEIGKKEGYLIIIEKREAGVFYAPASVDITDKVIQQYNAKPAQKSGKEK